jgi:arginase family enzyme
MISASLFTIHLTSGKDPNFIKLQHSGLGERARIAGFDLVELYPPADFDGMSALTAARILVNVVGTVVRQG